MSDSQPASSSRAVFLSYASQDAEAVERIAVALREAGVEIWFDKSELTGGDAWDAKIRGQIGSCVLFAPIISASTQARGEGYFRLEWKLAVDRSHLMAHDQPFLLPIVIDATKDSEARVPPEFRAVQWTRLPGGDTNPAFCSRVRKLLVGEVAPVGPVADRAPSLRPGQQQTRLSSRSWSVPAMIGVGLLLALAAFFALRPRRNPEEVAKPVQNTRTVTASAAAKAESGVQSLTKAQQLVAQARLLYEPWDLASMDDFKLAEQLLKQATELEPANAEAWAALAIEAMGQHFFGYERNDARDALLRTAAERAVKLAPESDFAKLALAFRYRRGPGTDADALRILQELAPRHPMDKFLLRQLGGMLAANHRDEEALACYVRVAALPGGDAIALIGQERILERQNRLDEAEAALESALALRPDYGLAHLLKIGLQFYQRGDLERTRRALQAVPTLVLTSDDRVAMGSAIFWYIARDAGKASEALRYVSHDHIESANISMPKGLFAGLVHRLAGRNEAAAIEWRQAVRLLDQRLAANPASVGDVGDRAALLALLGDRTAAEAGLSVYQQLTRARPGRADQNSWTIYAELGHSDVVADFFARQLKSQGNASIYAALFKFHPVIDRFRDQPRFQALASEAERVLAERTVTPVSTSSSGGEQAAPAGLPAPPDKSVAVLAFADNSPAHDSEYFSDGISDELINALGKVPGLKVPARTSSFYFKGKSVPMPEIAKQLGVAYVIEGSVQRAGDKVKISARLSKASDGFQVWTDSFLRDAKDVFAVEDEIAGLIAEQLSLKLGVSSAASTASVNPRASELYLQATQTRLMSDQAAAATLAESLFRQALELEPKFARAHAALTGLWLLRAASDREIGRFDQRASVEMARLTAKAREGVALDDDSSDSHATLGLALALGWKVDEAFSEFKRALILNPNDINSHTGIGGGMRATGRMDEALEEGRRAFELDPLAVGNLTTYGHALDEAGQYTAACAIYDRALALQPMSKESLTDKATTLARLGRIDDALAIVPGLQENVAGIVMRRIMILRLAGRLSEAEALHAKGGDRSAMAWLALGRREEALDALDPGAVTAFTVHYWMWDPMVDPIREDARFANFLATLGLTEAHTRAQTWRKAHPPEKPAVK